MKTVCILTCDWAPVVISRDPGEANAAGCWVWHIQIHWRVWTVCRKTGNNLNDLRHTVHVVLYKHAHTIILYGVIYSHNQSFNLMLKYTHFVITPNSTFESPNLLPLHCRCFETQFTVEFQNQQFHLFQETEKNYSTYNPNKQLGTRGIIVPNWTFRLERDQMSRQNALWCMRIKIHSVLKNVSSLKHTWRKNNLWHIVKWYSLLTAR